MKTLYKPLGMVVGVVGGIAANAVFHRIWTRATGERTVPTATAKGYDWREVLLAAALQGAVFGLVKAAVDRAGATGYESLTGTWPGDS
ncbi:DUF4235 domain-containing protein [Nocardia blacklockiae]|uniref:DUF4235 domain-containing protein n=1 Tax=Nocardia blacklockiae TaxID=480036 RepID=UPI001894B322|nr:DUF4235 domain-containing protein [Nocardia blacklockiae]MBF6175317.1 DUF4235 domain-containing protein [Nocardia blacklockiae]